MSNFNLILSVEKKLQTFSTFLFRKRRLHESLFTNCRKRMKKSKLSKVIKNVDKNVDDENDDDDDDDFETTFNLNSQ